MEKRCSFEGCDRSGKIVKGYCFGHYRQQSKGLPLKPLKWKRTAPVRDETGKTCNTCREHKPYEDYHVSTQNVDGRQGKCKECQNAGMREAYARKQLAKAN